MKTLPMSRLHEAVNRAQRLDSTGDVVLRNQVVQQSFELPLPLASIRQVWIDAGFMRST
jgi:hypothetical protein